MTTRVIVEGLLNPNTKKVKEKQVIDNYEYHETKELKKK